MNVKDKLQNKTRKKKQDATYDFKCTLLKLSHLN